MGESGEGSGRLVPWVVSAGSESALRDHARALLACLENSPQADISEVARALAKLPRLRHRAVVLGRERGRLRDGLTALAQGDAAANLVQGRACAQARVVFVFPGQGPQWAGMALALLEESDVFHARVYACAQALAPFVDWSLLDVLRGSSAAPSPERIDVVQPALFSVMLALADVWRSFGVKPAAVLGHSLGEVIAANAAGGMSLQDGARLVALWSKAQATLAGSGDIASVALSPDELQPRLARRRVVIAAINGPRWTAVSGDTVAVKELLAELDAEGVRARLIPACQAAHSPRIEVLRERLLSDLAPIVPRHGETPMYSTLTGELFDTTGLHASHWFHCLRQTVLFEQATRALLERGHDIFIEMSPHPVLAVALHDTIDASGRDAAVLAALRRDQGGMARVLTALAEAHVRGVELDWRAVLGNARDDAQPLDLPEARGEDADRVEVRAGDPAEVRAGDRAGIRAGGEPAGPAKRDPSPLARRLAGLAEDARRRALLELIGIQMAAILGHSEADAVAPRTSFREQGLDSLGAVELVRRVSELAGVPLATVVVFDHPTPAALARHLHRQIMGVGAPGAVPAGRSAGHGPIAIVGMSCRYPGGIRSPRSCGSWCWPAATPSPSFPPIAAGTCRRFCAPIPTPTAHATPARAGSCMTRPSSMRGSSGSARARRWRWIRSSGCCWKRLGGV